MAKKSIFRRGLDTFVDMIGYVPYTKKEATGFKSYSMNVGRTKNSNIRQNGIMKPWKVSFKVLRKIASHDAVCRICVDTIKKAVSQCPWDIKVRKHIQKPRSEYASRIEDVREFLQDMNVNWENMRILLDRVLEDLLVLDAGVIEKIWTFDWTELIGLNSVDWATIRPIYNEYWEVDHNRAFVQVMDWAKDKVYFSQKEMIYMMANPQNDVELFWYGRSPIESIMLQVQAALQADMYNIKNFTKDNIPPGMLDLWDVSEEEATNFIALWNATVVGNNQQMKFVWWPWDKKFQQFRESNRDMQYAQYLDWLARIKLAAYWLTSIDANITQDVNKALAGTQKQMSNSKGIRNAKSLVEEYFNSYVLWEMWPEYKDLTFSFDAPEDIETQYKQAEIDKIYVEAGVTWAEHIAEERGLRHNPNEYWEEIWPEVANALGDGTEASSTQTKVYDKPLY